MLKGGHLRVIDLAAGQKCKASATALAWSQVGPTGPAGAPGDAGAQGPQGPEGEKGDPGASLTSFDSIDQMPCTREGRAGKIALAYSADGTATLECVLPCLDDFSDDRNDRHMLATDVSLDRPSQWAVDGTTCAGDSDWFGLDVTPGGPPGGATIRIKLTDTSGDARVCAQSGIVAVRRCGDTDDTITYTEVDGVRGDGQFLIEVRANTPGSYKLEVDIIPYT